MGMKATAFILSVILGKQTIVDVFWGLGYVFIAWVTFIKTGVYAPQHKYRYTVTFIRVLLVTDLYLDSRILV